MKYILSLFLFISCSVDTIDNQGITSRICAQYFQKSESAYRDLSQAMIVLCLRGGYKDYTMLRTWSVRIHSDIKACGYAQCLKEKIK